MSAKGTSTILDERRRPCFITGAGAANPTRRLIANIAVTRTGVGVIRYTFTGHPGTWIGLDGAPAIRAAVPANVKGHTIVAGDYVAPTATASGYIELSLFDSTFTADDLQLAEYIDVVFLFAASSVNK